MKMNRFQNMALEAALSNWSHRNGVSIYTINDDLELWDSDTKVLYGVNWSCCGTVEVAKAKEYAEALTCGAGIADTLNKMEMQLEWTELPKLDAEQKKEYRNHIIELETAIGLQDAALIQLCLGRIKDICG